MWGPFCYVFLLIGAARALTPVQMFEGGGGGGWANPKKDHHKNITPPHNKKSSKKGPHMEKKPLKDPICMEIKIAKRPPQAAWQKRPHIKNKNVAKRPPIGEKGSKKAPK